METSIQSNTGLTAPQDPITGQGMQGGMGVQPDGGGMFPVGAQIPVECYAAKSIAEFQQCVYGKSWGSVGSGGGSPGAEASENLGWNQWKFPISSPKYNYSYTTGVGKGGQGTGVIAGGVGAEVAGGPTTFPIFTPGSDGIPTDMIFRTGEWGEQGLNYDYGIRNPNGDVTPYYPQGDYSLDGSTTHPLGEEGWTSLPNPEGGGGPEQLAGLPEYKFIDAPIDYYGYNAGHGTLSPEAGRYQTLVENFPGEEPSSIVSAGGVDPGHTRISTLDALDFNIAMDKVNDPLLQSQISEAFYDEIASKEILPNLRVSQDYDAAYRALEQDVIAKHGIDAVDPSALDDAASDLVQMKLDGNEQPFIDATAGTELGASLGQLGLAGGLGAATSVLGAYAMSGFDAEETDWGQAAFTGAASGIAAEAATAAGLTIAGSATLAGAAVGGGVGILAGQLYNFGDSMIHHMYDHKSHPDRIPVRSEPMYDEEGYYTGVENEGDWNEDYAGGRGKYWAKNYRDPENQGWRSGQDLETGEFLNRGEKRRDAARFGMEGGFQSTEENHHPMFDTNYVQVYDRGLGLQLQDHIDELSGGAGKSPFIVTQYDPRNTGTGEKGKPEHSSQYELKPVILDMQQTESIEELNEFQQIFDQEYWQMGEGEDTYFDYNTFMRDWDDLTEFSREQSVNNYHWDRGYYWTMHEQFADDHGAIDEWKENDYSSRAKRTQAETDWLNEDELWQKIDEQRDPGYQQWWDKAMDKAGQYSQEELDDMMETQQWNAMIKQNANARLSTAIQSKPKDKTMQKLGRILPLRG